MIVKLTKEEKKVLQMALIRGEINTSTIPRIVELFKNINPFLELMMSVTDDEEEEYKNKPQHCKNNNINK